MSRLANSRETGFGVPKDEKEAFSLYERAAHTGSGPAMYTLGLCFEDGRVTPQDFGSVTGVLLAPIVGLLGAATGYYYGRGER